MSSSLLQRRQLLRLLAGSAAALPLAGLFPRRGAAAGPNARRIIFFYAPDGVHEADWGLEGRQLSALGEQKRNVVLLRNVTMSQGEGHNDGAKQLLKEADLALYSAKASGRNRVTVASRARSS